jgi:hypothetical protein
MDYRKCTACGISVVSDLLRHGRCIPCSLDASHALSKAEGVIARLRAEVEELQKKVSDLDHDNTRMIDAGFFELIMGPSVDLMTGEPIPTTVLPPDSYYDFCRDDPKAAAERIYQLETLVRGLRKHPTAAREGE